MVNKDLKKPTEEDEGNLSDEVNNQALLLDEIVDSLSETISDLKNIKESDSNYLLSETLTILPEDGIDFHQATKSFEISLIKKALILSEGNQTKAAKLLKMNVTTLNAAIKRHGIVH